MNERKQKLEAIFEEALALSIPEERARRLDEACGNDLDLRREVEELLRAADEAGGFLAMRQGETAALSNYPVPSSETESASVERSGDYIGRYKLLQKIGEGGCGVVYMAEQEEPVRRRVALKIIKLGMDTRQVVARFEVERQALAMMDHPNIAKIFDAGSTQRPLTQPATPQPSTLNPQLPAGRPYFVMELVRGVRITEYCDENNLSTTQRLDLFVQVCQAVQHAHQKGIIHRDLKPSNVLVTINDGAPVPKVIDFGVAKATEQRLTEKTLFTEFHQFIGTPAYMSPEQALMTSLDIDTRSDIYSLGVLLYELLTGRTPLNTPELLKAGIDEMRRTIRETEPARPSNRLSTLPREDLTTAAKRRSTNPPHLIHAIRGDLDWIVMKCLEKDRTRRYETANGLAADLRRHLSNEPVAARPPSRLYQFQKTVQRNKIVFAAASAVLVALFSGLTLATWAFMRERAARNQTAIEATKSRQVAKLLKDMIQSIEPSVAMDRDTTLLREIADRTLAQIEMDRNVPPEVEVELRATLGEVYHHLGDYKKGEAMHRETVPRMRALLGNNHPDLADLLRDYACTLQDRDKHEEARSAAREALAISQKLHGPEHPDVAASLQIIARTLDSHKDAAEAEALHRQTIELYRKLRGPEHRDVANGLRWLAMMLKEQGRFEEAESAFREALTMMKRVQGDVHPDVDILLRDYADFQGGRKNFREQEALYRELLPIQRKLLGNERHRVATTLNNIGAAIHNSGRYAEAEPYLRESLALRKRLGDEDKELARTTHNLGMTLRELGRFSEAEALYRDALALRRKLLKANDPDLAETIKYLGRVLADQRKFAEAEVLFKERLSLARETAAKKPEQLEGSLNDLAETIYREKRHAEAEPLYLELLQLRRQRLVPDHDDIVNASASIGRLLTDWAWAERDRSADFSPLQRGNERDPKRSQGRTPSELAREGERLLREALAAKLQGNNAVHWRTDELRSRLGAAILSVAVTDPELTPAARESKFAEAETLLVEGHNAMQQRKPERKYQRDTLERLARLYEVWKKPDQAAGWRAKLEEFERAETARESVTAEGTPR